MERTASVEDMVGNLWRLGRTPSQAEFEQFFSNIAQVGSQQNLAAAAQAAATANKGADTGDAAAAAAGIPRVASIDLLRKMMMNQAAGVGAAGSPTASPIPTMMPGMHPGLANAGASPRPDREPSSPARRDSANFPPTAKICRPSLLSEEKDAVRRRPVVRRRVDFCSLLRRPPSRLAPRSPPDDAPRPSPPFPPLPLPPHSPAAFGAFAGVNGVNGMGAGVLPGAVPGVVAMPGVAPAADLGAAAAEKKGAAKKPPAKKQKVSATKGAATPDKEKKSAKGANKRSVTPEGASAGDDDNDDSEDEELDTTGKTTDEIRRQRRMLSNRESARRSRRRKLEHVAVLEGQINGHKAENAALVERLREVELRAESAIRENAGLKAEVERLTAALREAVGGKGVERSSSLQRIASAGNLVKDNPVVGSPQIGVDADSPRGFVPFRSLQSYENLLSLQAQTGR